MPVEDPFQQLCERVRFSLDEPADPALEGRDGIVDFVARVRSGGLQVTRSTVPAVYRAVERVREALHLTSEPEVYVVNDVSANAYAPAYGLRRAPIIVLNSGLITLLGAKELEFAIAHELGHLGLRHGRTHHRISAGSEFEALQARSLQRYAEVSADRVALVAVRSVYVAARVMVKLASGLPSESLGLDIDGFVRQLERDPGESSRAWELDQTHPSLPFRLLALLRFSQSADYNLLAGQGTGGEPLAELDQRLALKFAELGDGRLSEMESHAFQMALVWAATAMVMNEGGIGSAERMALDRLVGPERTKKAISFAESQGRDAVLAKLTESVQRVNAAPLATRRKLEHAMRAFALSLNLELGETDAGQIVASSFSLR